MTSVSKGTERNNFCLMTFLDFNSVLMFKVLDIERITRMHMSSIHGIVRNR
jgi:hypothetical protein